MPSFPFPVDPPTSRPDDGPLFQVCVNADWLPFIAGSLKQLLLGATWNYATDADLLDIQGRVFDLISKFNQIDAGCQQPVPSQGCFDGNFVNLDYGFTDFGGGICAATWVVTSGWQSCYDAPNSQDILYLQRDFDETQIDSYHFNLSYSGVPRVGVAAVKWYLHGVLQRTDNFVQPLGTVLYLSSTSPVLADRVEITSSFGTNVSSVPYWATDFEMCYSGAFPLFNRDTWTHTLDFAASAWSFAPWAAPVVAGSDGSYSPGTGFVDGDGQLGGAGNYYRSCLIQRMFAANITAVSFKFDRSAISTDQPHANLFTLITNDDGSVVLASQDVDHSSTGTDLVLAWTGVETVAGLTLQVVSSYWDSSGHETGSILIKSVTISGFGPDPF